MVRRTRGEDIDAACGQLKGQVMDRTRRQAEFRRKLEEGDRRMRRERAPMRPRRSRSSALARRVHDRRQRQRQEGNARKPRKPMRHASIPSSARSTCSRAISRSRSRTSTRRSTYDPDYADAHTVLGRALRAHRRRQAGRGTLPPRRAAPAQGRHRVQQLRRVPLQGRPVRRSRGYFDRAIADPFYNTPEVAHDQ